MESCNTNTLNLTAHGKVLDCTTCNKLHIEFNNLYFSFTKEEYRAFRKYFNELDAEYWEDLNERTFFRRKVIVPIGNKNVVAVFNAGEIAELRQLLVEPGKRVKNEYVDVKKMQYSMN